MLAEQKHLGGVKKAKLSKVKSNVAIEMAEKTRAYLSLWPSGLIRTGTNIKSQPNTLVKTRTNIKLLNRLIRSYKD